MNLHFFDWSSRTTSNPSGSTLVFLHGIGGVGSIWRPIAAALEDHHRCIAPDQRGHGKSRPLPASMNPTFSAYDYAHDVIELLERLALKSVTLVGHSMGARTALAVGHLLNKKSPALLQQTLKRVVCVDIGLQGAWGGGMGKPLADFLQTLPASFSSRAEMKHYLQSHCPDPSIAQYLLAVAKNTATPERWEFPFDHDAVVQTIYHANTTIAAPGTRPQTQSLSPMADWALEISEAGVPVNFLRGETSRVWSREDYLQQKSLLESPLLQFEEWEKCGHGLPFEQRVRFIEWIRERL